MSITYNYIDKVTNREINTSNIILSTDSGIVEVSNADSMRFTPLEQIEMKPVRSNGAYELRDKPTLPTRPDLTAFTPTSTEGSTVRTAYYFGIDSIELSQNTPDKKSAYISPLINIGTSSYIELDAKRNRMSSIEFYIVDGATEAPILPVGDNVVQDEKLFWGLPTRFTVNGNEDIVIKKNGAVTTLNLNNVYDENFSAGVYTVTYTPAEQSHRYSPQNQQIRVKVIQRCENDATPAIIQSITIRKHGGDKIWSIKE